jgi:protein-tyrosine phosphatase
MPTYALIFAALSGLLTTAAVIHGGAAWLLLWPAVSFFAVATAYAGLGSRVFGKRTDGSLPPWSLAVNLPFLLLAWGVWHLQRRLERQSAMHEVAPRLWVGRRPLGHEVPPGVDWVVDLAAEFPAAGGVATGRAYTSFPVLDAMAPDESRLRDLVARLAVWPGPVLIHCAQGHGRSATVAAAILVARGVAANGDAAVALIRQVRPAAQLKPSQRALLRRLDA